MGSNPRKVRFVCISDTHNHAPGEGYTLPKGDVLIHAGDLTNQGGYHELKKAVDWIKKTDFGVKIIVAGNHDLSLDPNYKVREDKGWSVASDDIGQCRELMESNNDPGFYYLQHSSATVKLLEHDTSFNVFGSPYSRATRPDQNWAFQYPGESAQGLWDDVPMDTDILITHTPPAGLCDESQHWQAGGCPALAKTLWNVKPVLHVCGHCHEGRGARIVRWGEDPGTLEVARDWIDPGRGTKKVSLFDLTGKRGSQALEKGRETAVVNAAVVARSWDKGPKEFNKPIVVDIVL